MSFVVTVPEAVAAAAGDLAAIGSTLREATAAAAGPTTGLAAAAADDVSIAVSQLFGRYGQEFQTVSNQLAAFHTEFVRTLNQARRRISTPKALTAGSCSVRSRRDSAPFPRPRPPLRAAHTANSLPTRPPTWNPSTAHGRPTRSHSSARSSPTSRFTGSRSPRRSPTPSRTSRPGGEFASGHRRGRPAIPGLQRGVLHPTDY